MSRLREFAKYAVEILLAVTAVLAAVTVHKFLLFPALESIFGFNDSVIPYIKVAGSLVMMAAAYWAYVKFYEKRTAKELNFRPRSLIVGALSGALIISLTTLILFGLGNYELIGIQGFSTVAVVVLPVLAVSIFEEFLFRGVLFRITEQRIGTLYSLVAVSILFSAVHMGNEGANVMVFVSAVLISALWCGVYIVSRNIWVSGLHHAAWNIAIFSSGVPLSGMVDWAQHAPLVSSFHGPVWLTGGSFGPEGSIITIVICGISVPLLLRWAWRNGCFVNPNATKSEAHETTHSGVTPAIDV